MGTRVSLPVLDDRIDARARATRASHPWWPCAEGCDQCCRSLPHLPTITRAEWERLALALASLPEDVRRDVESRTASASEHRAGRVVCPMLDLTRGACRVYHARPIACRTYGFYAERDGGLHCGKVTAAVEEHGAEEAVVWGNGESIAHDLRGFGEVRSLASWMAERVQAPLSSSGRNR